MKKILILLYFTLFYNGYFIAAQVDPDLCMKNQNLIFEPLPLIAISPGPIQTFSYSNRNFLITQDVFVGGFNYSFTNCKFKISPGKKIRFNYGNGKFVECELYSCDGAFWEGIEVIGNSKLEMWGSELHFANTAIKSDCGSFLTLSNNEFYHNNLGIDFKRLSTQSAAAKINILRFYNNKFIGWLRNNSLADKSYFGYGGKIEGITTLLNLGSATSSLTANVFKNLKGGLLIKNSNVSVNNCKFQEILSNSPATPDIQNGRGIMIVNTANSPIEFRLSARYNSSFYSFIDCEENFVHSRGNVNVNISNIGFQYTVHDYGQRSSHNQHNGIYIGSNKNTSININNNKFDYDRNYTMLIPGNMIKLELCNSNFNSKISGNQLNDNAPTNDFFLTAAIELINAIQQNNFDFIIENNPINKKLYTGINLFNCIKMKVHNNNAIKNIGTKFDVSDFVGINIKGGEKNVITSNGITGQTALVENGNHSGIFIDASKSDSLCDNEVNLTRNGIRARNNCTGASVISATKFGTHHFGLHYEESTEHMQQIHKGNLWTGTCNKDARYLGSKTKPNQYLICDERQSDCDLKGYGAGIFFPPVIEQNGDWILHNDGYLQSCNGLSFRRWKPYLDSPQFPYTDGDGIIWSRNQSFLSDYNSHPDLAIDSSTYNHYLSLTTTNDMNYFNAKLAVETIYNLNDPQRLSILNLTQQLENINFQINMLYENFEDSLDLENNNDFNSALGTLLNNYDFVKLNLDQVYQGIYIDVQSKINQAQSQNSNLQPNNSIQSDEKLVSQAILDLHNGLELSAIQRLQLLQIAQKCYRLSGDVVYKAFSLLDDSTRQAINSSFPNECNLFENAQSRIKTELESKIMPNPTKGIVNYQSNDEIDQIEIYSLNGVSLIHKKGNLGKYGKINLENLPKGIYFAKLISKNSDARIERIILE